MHSVPWLGLYPNPLSNSIGIRQEEPWRNGLVHDSSRKAP